MINIMERRDFFKRLGIAGAAIAISPQILAEISPKQSPAIGGGKEAFLKLPDGRTIPLGEYTAELPPPHSSGGLYLDDVRVFDITAWSLTTRRPLFEKPYTVDNNPEWREYTSGNISSYLNVRGQVLEARIPFNLEGKFHAILFTQDGTIDAEGYLTSLSYGENGLEAEVDFAISGEILKTV